jgi:Holliday junction resolvasome RuvABC endonuclease subunit
MKASAALSLFDSPAAKWVPPLLGECVLGIDPSLTGFAICYSVPGKRIETNRWASKPASTVRDRVARYERVIRGVIELVHAQQFDLILIEGYSYGSASRKQQGHHDRAELGGVLRWRLCELTQCPIIEPAPSSLKKFVTGNGVGSKDIMVSTLAVQHQRVFSNDDDADAFALCQLGLALTGQLPPPSTKVERLYLDKLRLSYGLPSTKG